jgi:D-threo-aldose 1-dehydrogenase
MAFKLALCYKSSIGTDFIPSKRSTMTGIKALGQIDFPTVGVGTAAWGPPFPAIPQEQAANLVDRVLSRKPAFFDTAPIYGSGISEKWLGEALAGRPRDHFVVSSKAGYNTLTPHYSIDLSRENILHSVETSLKRLQLDHLDILHLHDPDCCLADALDIAYPVLASLREQGLVRAIGAGMNQWEMLVELARNVDFDCFLLAGRYTLLEQESLPLLNLCGEKGIYLFLGGVFNTGILATGAVDGARYNYQTASKAVLERVAKMEAICAKHHVSLRSAALQFPLAHPAVKSLVIGMQSTAEYEDALNSLSAVIPAEFWDELRLNGLISQEAPLPQPC